MAVIDDNALILHFYGEDATPEARDLIAHALVVSPEMRARYARLREILSAADSVAPTPPDNDFERRILDNFDARLRAEQSARQQAPLPVGEGLGRGSAEVHAPHSRRSTTGRPTRTASHARPRSRLRFLAAAAASVLLILATGFFAGRLTVPDAPPPIAQQQQADPLLATKVLDSYVAAHLRDTEGMLQTALSSDDTAATADVARALIDSNRLYATAAARAGNTQLADFLRQMEPVLIELANPAPGDGIEVRKGLREYVRDSDLLFQVRATEGRLASRNTRA